MASTLQQARRVTSITAILAACRMLSALGRSQQAMRLVGKPVYGTQFHGEMTSDQLRRRLLMYQDAYLESEEQAGEVVEGLQATPEARGLLRRFLELYT